MENNKHPILYSFRRCPYAMRARLAIKASEILVEIREITLKEKPLEFLKLSPKGTVPVLVTYSGNVLEESIDIINWALNINDPQKWLAKGQLSQSQINQLLNNLENQFKPNLDRYKYPNRFENINRDFHRDKNLDFLRYLDDLIKKNRALNCSHLSLIDYAIFPFIRQFRNVDDKWFDSLNFNFLKKWLFQLIDSKNFLSIMKKYDKWESINTPIYTKFL